MDIDVNQIRGKIEFEKGDRIAPNGQKAAIGLRQRVLERTVPEKSTVEEKILTAVIAPAQVRMPDEPPNSEIFGA